MAQFASPLVPGFAIVVFTNLRFCTGYVRLMPLRSYELVDALSQRTFSKSISLAIVRPEMFVARPPPMPMRMHCQLILG